MTWWILLAIAGFLTWLSSRNASLGYAVSAFFLWFAVWGYHLNNPPANVVIGTLVYDLLYYTFLIMAFATLLWYWRNRGRTESQTRISEGDGEILTRNETRTGVTPNQSLMSMSPEEYRNHVRNRTRRRRR